MCIVYWAMSFYERGGNEMSRCLVYENDMNRMFGFWWRMKKRDGEICSVFDAGDFCQEFN